MKMGRALCGRSHCSTQVPGGPEAWGGLSLDSRGQEMAALTVHGPCPHGSFCLEDTRPQLL